jgi:hypothetical protein
VNCPVPFDALCRGDARHGDGAASDLVPALDLVELTGIGPLTRSMKRFARCRARPPVEGCKLARTQQGRPDSTPCRDTPIGEGSGLENCSHRLYRFDSESLSAPHQPHGDVAQPAERRWQRRRRRVAPRRLHQHHRPALVAQGTERQRAKLGPEVQVLPGTRMFAVAGDESADMIGLVEILFLGQLAIADLEDLVVGSNRAGLPARKQVAQDALRSPRVAASRLLPRPRRKGSACRTAIRWVVTVRAERLSAYGCRCKERISGSGQAGFMNRKVKHGKRAPSGTRPRNGPETAN